MARRLLICDANILIDMVSAGLTQEMFQLPYRFATPNLLFEQELADQHPELTDRGLELHELNPTSIEKALSLSVKYKGVSSMDTIAVALAIQEQTTLLTGDAKLRQTCMQEDVEINGTIWLMEQLLSTGIIDIARARQAYDCMRLEGSRLPSNEIRDQLRKFRKI